MPPRKKASAAESERTSSTRGKTVQEATADEAVLESDGYFGETPDDTPNEHYTVSGVIEGKPVPETDTDR